jgi:hypothetical protein
MNEKLACKIYSYCINAWNMIVWQDIKTGERCKSNYVIL